MMKRDKVKLLLEQTIDCLKKEDFERLNDYLSKEITTNISLFGDKTIGNTEFIEKLKLGNSFDVSRWWVSNTCIRTSGTVAIMSAYLTIMLGIIRDGFLHSVELGGKMIVTFLEQDDIYKITDIKYDLDWTNGNTSFLDQFRLIDYTSKYDKDRCISINDAPWKIIGENDEIISEEEMIKETMSIYCFAVDNNDMDSLRLAETRDIYWLWDSPFDSYVVANDIEEHVRYFQKEENYVTRRQHPVRVVDIKINDDEAEMLVYLLRKNHIRGSELNITNMDVQYYNSVYHNQLKKENGIWKLKDMRYNYYQLPQELGFLDRIYID